MKKNIAPKICVNPDCEKSFIPSRKNKIYCSTKCQSDFSNSLTDEQRKENAINKAVKNNDTILAGIFRESGLWGADLKNLSGEILKQRKFKPEFYRRHEDIKNEEPIYWMDVFGVQFNDKEKERFSLKYKWQKYSSSN